MKIKFITLLALAWTMLAPAQTAGIYGGQVDDITFSDPDAGVFAVFVGTNGEATVVGYDVDSFQHYNGQAGGVAAQFNVPANGNWNFSSNNTIYGVSGSGSIGTNGLFNGELNFTNGDSVLLTNGYRQSPSGNFQNAAGCYSGTYSGTYHSTPISGPITGVLSANGQIVFSVFQNGALNDGGQGQFDTNNYFITTNRTDGSVLSGTLTNAMLQIGGTFNSPSSASGTFTMTRSANIPVPFDVTTTSLPDGIINAPYNQALTASGGQTPYSWTSVSGGLPAGLTLATNGVISGTPTTAGTTNFTVQVTDAASDTATQALSLTIDALDTNVVFSVTPSAVGNTYNGVITLQVSGLATGETVVVQKYLDRNTNGVIDGSDWLVQQFTLQDGTNFVIGGVTNFNVPGDLNATTGAITATLNFQNGDFVQNIIGNYLFRLSNPGGHFEPITNQFAVTNFPFAQTLTGNVVSNSASTTLPNVIVLLFPPPVPGSEGPSGNPLAGVVANNAGSYTVHAPPGTYMPVAFEGNYVANMSTAPVLTLAASQTITTNLTLASATTNISGNIVDAGNSGIGLPGVMLPVMSNDGLLAITFTDTNGNFDVPVTAGDWGLKPLETALIVHGYLRLQNGTSATAGATGVSLAVPMATALIYGSVKDNMGNPLVGIDVEAYDNNDVYESDGYTDANGNYVIGVLGSLTDDNWHAEVSTDSNPANYNYSQNDSTNISVGQAVLENFTALPATNHITGMVKDSNNNPIAGVGVDANATINGTNYQARADTDSNGQYSLNVANGTWNISINCNGGDDSLDNILGSGSYKCPDNQMEVINSNNATNNFTVQFCGGISISTTSLPLGEVGVYYDQTLLASSCNIGAYNWTLIGGSLPSGLTLGSNGEIYGISDTNGTYTFTVQVTDSGSLTTNGQFSISISNAVQVTTTTLPDGFNNQNYSQQLQAAAGVPFGGASPYSWSLASGSASLPTNLTLTTNGLLSGTLADSGTFDFTVEVTDSLGGTFDQPLSLTITSAPDVLTYYVTKLEAFQQLDASNIVLNTNAGPYNAFLGIVQSSLDMVPIATVTLPTGAVKGLPWGSSAIEIRSQESFTSQASFDAAYPPGDYDFALYGMNDGLRFPVLSMPTPVYPNPPHVSNFAAAQSLNPLAAFTLQWDAIPGGTTDDSLWVVITDATGDPVFSTPYPPMDLAGSLKGTATSVVIPTNTFQFGHAYMGTITFFRTTSVNTTSYPGAVGVTVVGVQTWFPLAMVSASPVLSHTAKLSSTQFGFQISGIVGQNYTVLFSTNVSLPMSNWIPVLITNLSTSPAFIKDYQATNKQRFYRVLFGP